MHCHSVRRQFDWILWLDRLIIDAITLPFQACTYWATPSTVDEIIKNVYHLNWIVMPKNLIHHLPGLSSTLKIKIYLAYFKKTFWGIFQHCVPLSVTLSSQELLLDHGFFGENFKALSNQCALLVLPFFVTGATLNLVVSWHVIAIFFASDARWTQSRIFLLSYQPLANAVVTCGTPAQLVKVTR